MYVCISFGSDRLVLVNICVEMNYFCSRISWWWTFGVSCGHQSCVCIKSLWPAATTYVTYVQFLMVVLPVISFDFSLYILKNFSDSKPKLWHTLVLIISPLCWSVFFWNSKNLVCFFMALDGKTFTQILRFIINIDCNW